MIPAGNEPSGCASIHLANAARVTYHAACSGVVDLKQECAGKWILGYFFPASLI